MARITISFDIDDALLPEFPENLPAYIPADHPMSNVVIAHDRALIALVCDQLKDYSTSDLSVAWEIEENA